MTTRRTVRRSLAVLASTGLGAALAFIPSGSALAAVQGQYVASAQAEATFIGNGGGTCTLSSGDDSVETNPVAFTHGTKHRSVDLDATFTNSLDPSDQVRVKGHGDSTLTLKKRHKDLSAFDLTFGGSVKISHTIIGSQCRGSGDVLASTEVIFTEHKKGVLTLTRSTKKPGSVLTFVLFNVDTDRAVVIDAFEGSHSHNTAHVTLKPGKYGIAETEVGIEAGSSVVLKNAARTSKVAQTLHLHATFTPKKH
jgi:hypothetical protein